MVETWAKAAEEVVVFAIARGVEYKDSDAFMSNAIATTMGIYVASFDGCKVRVVEA